MKKTADRIKVTNILRIATQIGAEIRDGRGGHFYMLRFPNLRPCPIAESTDAERMVAPWIAQITGRTRREAYHALKHGYWNLN